QRMVDVARRHRVDDDLERQGLVVHDDRVLQIDVARRSPTGAPVRLRPSSVTATVSPGSPAPGRTAVTVGVPGGTTKNSIVDCPLSVVTMRSRASAPPLAAGG